MRISFRSAIVLLVTVLILLSSGCANCTKNNSEAEKFSQIRNSFVDSIKQLKSEPGITITGFASDQEKLLIKVGIGIDQNIISDIRFKQIINKYIGNFPQEILEPYNLEIEEIDKEKGSSWLVAEKPANTTIINWIQ